MADFDVRLGLTPTDLELRAIQVRRPDEWVDLKSLVGPPARIKERFRAWEDSGATGVTVRSRQPEAIDGFPEGAGPHQGDRRWARVL